MTTITREEVKAFIEQIESDLSNGWEAQIFELKLARIALAALEAEPVAYIFKHPAGELFWSLTDESNKGQNDVMPVYAAPPASERERIRRKTEPVAYLVCNGHLYQDRPFLDLSTARKSVKDRNDGAEIKALCVCEISAEK
ncbi:hypothetical protein NU090_004162 [Salmonella enterica]|nr:hypothetical protein [Salmonella enterica]EIQ2385637.1 hypothetical protein [Salmonella enterica]EJP3137004.1 hypothetical protein [Salmonella enterica]EKZ9247066.1 hypothetical protein [Salmonella enterica]ELJ7883211.1 hypothetical protein [Salmonella enterica]